MGSNIQLIINIVLHTAASLCLAALLSLGIESNARNGSKGQLLAFAARVDITPSEEDIPSA